MTTKYKIIVGFTVMVLITGVVAILGYNGLQSASRGFEDYRALARLDVNMSDVVASMNQTTARTYEYIDSVDPQVAARAISVTERLIQMSSDTEKLVVDPSNLAKVQRITTLAKEYKSLQESMRTDISSIARIYKESVVPNSVALDKALDDIGSLSVQASNLDTLYSALETSSHYGQILAVIGRYSESYKQEEAELVTNLRAPMVEALNRMDRQIRTPGGRKLYEELMRAFNEMDRSFGQMVKQGAAVNSTIIALQKIENDINVLAREFSADVSDRRGQLGTETIDSNEAAQASMAIASLIGVLIGVAIALLIIVTFVRVLNQLASFASAIAAGDFTYKVRTKEKGEIGTMVQAMERIPAVLGDIIATATTLANNIRVGKLRERLDVANFNGSYRDLAVSVNTVGDAYTGMIDVMPIPLMTANKDMVVQFYNNACQGLVGGNNVNTQCRDNLCAAACSSADCFGKRAMSSGGSVVAETTADPQGNHIDASVTAVPLRNENGEIAAFIELITDLTAIKTQQRTMLQVANQASEISDRVAAASEELAAQVEQVSRGADMQRDRVESTASAMTEMNATVLEVARSAGQASDQSEGTRLKAEEGSELVSQVVKSIHLVNTVSSAMAENMQELGKQAESIGGVMNVISDIADQTNLLALNAAIEAARAGEAGRGFAVVADEVRKLAENTMTATQEVGSNISAIQLSTRKNMEEMANAVKAVTEATELANSSGAALSEIVELATANSSVVTSIATAAEQQSATSEEINRAIDEINKIVAETAEGMVQSSSAVQDLSRMAQELRRVMEGLQ